MYVGTLIVRNAMAMEIVLIKQAAKILIGIADFAMHVMGTEHARFNPVQTILMSVR